jgi:hypothetical protein
MNSRRTLLFSLLILVFGIISADAQQTFNGTDSAKTVQEIKKSMLFPADWTEGEFDRRKFLFALVDWPTDSASRIDLHIWVYNENHQEWRRILKIPMRELGNAQLFMDTQKGIVTVRGTANNEFRGVEVFRFNLRVVDNANYEK